MLNIPNRTKNLLEQNSNYHGFVLSCISYLKPWLSDNKTTFFPEYTDHGLTHLNEVLLTADSLISDQSWEHMTAQDAAAMIVSILLHDCAMHLTEDGFYSLIQDRMDSVSSRYIEPEKKWSDVWNVFFAEAKRFDASKLSSIFGDEVPVRDIPSNKLDLTGRDRLLIGEFIRRNHARIAHEIAFYGVPGVDGKSIKLGKEPDEYFLDLCGFIARSHNLSLRSAVDKLDRRKKQVHLNTHVPFIMLVLRISDYIQIHAERAPKQLLNLKNLVSPISRGEWKKHNAIVEINQAHEDPEAIYIDAEPDDAISFEGLRKLFSDIQSELDFSWSVLGEVYGRYEPLNKLGITIRRIRSSLDDLNDFILQKKPNYIPKILSFRTADSEMMELLISPLYGDKPEVGVRELMQNSVDACSELKDYRVKQGLSFDVVDDFDVCINLYDLGKKGGRLVIEDFGIGMTLEVVENYFLNIGASFRNSDRWKKEHETDGHSNVYRTGRFGIGLLAAYLLGDKLFVETRHVSQKEGEGISFECKKGSKSIVVSNCDLHIGTRITVELSKDVVSRLSSHVNEWDWYSLDSPRVIRKITTENKEKTLEQSRVVPCSYDNLDDSVWNRTISEGYDDIMWTYSHLGKDNSYYGRRSQILICNGVLVARYLNLDRFEISKKLNLIEAGTPSISVFDQDGRFPINLERSNLVGTNVPFKSAMAKDVASYLVKELLGFCKSLKKVDLSKESLNDIASVSIPGLYESDYGTRDNIGKFLIKRNCLVPLDFDLIAESNIDCIYIDPANISKGRGAWNSKTFAKLADNYVLVDKVSDTKQSRAGFVRAFFESNYMSSGLSALPIRSRRLLIKRSDVVEIVSPGYVPKSFWQRLDCEWKNDDWVLVSIGPVPKLDERLIKIAEELNKSKSFGMVVCYLDWSLIDNRHEASVFSQSWVKENGGVPFVVGS